MNATMKKVVEHLDMGWMMIENGINEAYEEGYSSVVWKLKQIQLQIENLEGEIHDKIYEDQDDG